MKIDEFKKYKKLVESTDSSELQNYPEATRIHNWMEETGRIDEGFFGTIWGWMKKNFSITGRKLHNLADEYEKELFAETRAEWFKIKDKEDLASKFRGSNYAKLSRDIEERMNIIAENDPDYTELVRALINKKNLIVKKALIGEFTGILDPSDVRSITKDTDSKLKSADIEEQRAFDKIAADKKDLFKPIALALQKKIDSKRSLFAEAKVATNTERQDFVKLLCVYVYNLSEKDKSVKFDEKTVYDFAKTYIEIVKEFSKKIESSDISLDKAIDIVRSVIDKKLKSAKPQHLEKLKAEIFKNVEEKVKGDETVDDEDVSGDDDVATEVEDEVTTDHTKDVLSKDDVKDAIDAAIEKTGEDKPTVDDVTSEIRDVVEKAFKVNIKSGAYARSLNREIKQFNSKPEAERKNAAKNMNFSLNKENKLDEATPETIKSLIVNYVDLVGMIEPFFTSEISKQSAFDTVSLYMFQIYAVKKDDKGKLSKTDQDNIIANMKAEEYI